MSAVAPPSQRLIIEPQRGWQPVDLGALLRYRELLWILAMRDVRVRYKQTVLGVLWAVIQPALTTTVFVFINRMGKFGTDDLPAPLLIYTKMTLWQLFANAMSGAGNSLLGNQNLITKVYFPRLVIPLTSVIVGLIDFAVAAVLLIPLMMYYHIVPGPRLLLMPVFIVLAFSAAVAAGLWLSALNVEFRDVRYVIPFLAQFWLYVTPVLYTTDDIAAHWKRALMGINPMSGIIEGFRWSLLGGPPPGVTLLISVLTVVAVLIGGLFYFRRMEKYFADLI